MEIGDWFVWPDGGIPILKTTHGYVNINGHALDLQSTVGFKILGKTYSKKFIQWGKENGQ